MASDALLDLLDDAVTHAIRDLSDAVSARRDYLQGSDLEDTAIPPEIEALIAPGSPASAWTKERHDANRDAK